MIEIIDKLKPKNGGSFKLIEDIDIAVSGYSSLADCVAHMATTAMIETIRAALSGKQDTLNSNQLNAVNSGITSELTAQITLNKLSIDSLTNRVSSAESNLSAIDNRITVTETELATQTARIDEIVALPEGSTTGDAELMDIRVKEDGTTSTSAGSAVRDQIGVLNSDLSVNIFNVKAWSNGSISDTTGNNVSSNERIRLNGYLPAYAKKISSSNTNGRFCLYAYDRADTFVGAWNGTSFARDGSGFFFAAFDMADFYNNLSYSGYQYRIVYRISGGSVQVDTVSGVYIESFLRDISLINKEIGDINEDIESLENQIDVLDSDLSVNIFNVHAWSNGSISDTTGSDVSSSERIKLTSYLPIYAKKVSSSVADGRFGLYAYNTNDVFIGAWNGTTFANDGSGLFYSEFDMSDFYNNPSYANYQYRLVYRISGGSVQIDTVTGVFIESFLRDIAEIISSLEMIDSDLETMHKNEKTLLMSQADNINNALIWEQGAISTSTGANANNSERVRTRCYIPTNANAIDMGVSSSTRGFYLLAYALDDTYIGAYKNDTDSFVKDGSETGYNTESESFDIGKFMRNYPQYRFRLSVYVRNSGSAITPSEAAGWLITSNLTNPTAQIRVIQYNAGKFNMGFDHSTPKIADIEEKIANYKEFFANTDADFIFMQEYTQYIDTNNTYPTDSTLFDPIYLYKSYYEHEVMMFGQHDMRRTYFTYLHTSGDHPAYAIVGEAHINGKLVAVVSGVLNSSAPQGIDHEQQGIRALTKLTTQILKRYDYAIVGMDCNCLNQTEAIDFYNFMVGKGYRAGNWAYLGYKDTYNLSSQQYKAIDNVFVKGNMKIVNFNVPDVYADLASDHFPVIVDIRMS